jgi:hypothetical protein
MSAAAWAEFGKAICAGAFKNLKKLDLMGTIFLMMIASIIVTYRISPHTAVSRHAA